MNPNEIKKYPRLCLKCSHSLTEVDILDKNGRTTHRTEWHCPECGSVYYRLTDTVMNPEEFEQRSLLADSPEDVEQLARLLFGYREPASVSTFDEYQVAARRTAVYPGDTVAERVWYVALGLGGESGEVLNQVKKVVRDDDGLTQSRREKIIDEMGDVLWYLSQMASEMNESLETVARQNLQKLAERAEKNQLKGDKREEMATIPLFNIPISEELLSSIFPTGVVDNGQPKERQSIAGGVRQRSDGQGRYDLISSIGLRRLAIHYENGAKKYDDNNWRLGIKVAGCINSIFRHTVKLMLGWSDEDHAAAIAWNAFAIMEILERIELKQLPDELDDRFKPLIGYGENKDGHK